MSDRLCDTCERAGSGMDCWRTTKDCDYKPKQIKEKPMTRVESNVDIISRVNDALHNMDDDEARFMRPLLAILADISKSLAIIAMLKDGETNDQT